MRRYELAPSILSADFARLGEQIAAVERYSGRIHVDVMDGHFVPNLTMGPVVVRSIRPVVSVPIEVHLMVREPDIFVDAFIDAGADRLIFHIEVRPDPRELVVTIQKRGAAAGLALNPETPWERIEGHLEDIDLVTVMTVNPGFGGQAFLVEMLPKVAAARRSVTERSLSVDIEVDGGVTPTTAARAKEAGANVFVAGNSVFESPDPSEAARRLVDVIGSR